MSKKTLRKRVFNILKRFETSSEIQKVFGNEQKKGHRPYTKFWDRIKNEEKLQYEILFEQYRHPKLCAKTLQSLSYSFAVVYQRQTTNELLKDYCAAVMGKYEFGFSKFDKIIKQRELKLIDYILDQNTFDDIRDDIETKRFLIQVFTLLLFYSDLKYSNETEDALELLITALEDGTVSLK